MNVKKLKRRILTVGLVSLLASATPIINTDYTMIAKASQYTNTSDDSESNAKLNVKSKSLVTNTSFTIKVYNVEDSQSVTFKSDNTDIASVDKDGVVTATDKIGTVIITATIKDKSKTIKTLDCEVTVGPPAASIKLAKNELTLAVDARYPFLENILIIKPNTTVEIPKFKSSDTDVAVISTSGKITAKKTGTTTIEASLDNGSTVTCTVTVVEEKK